MLVMPGILALLVAVAGWHYLFYSKSASRLGGIEEPRLNRLRVRLRRANGAVMFLFAGFFYAGFYTFGDRHPNVRLFVAVWVVVVVLLVVMVALAFADLRLTAKLRRRFQSKR